MAAVLLVFQYGQPRIFFAMARDGLLPQWAAQGQRQVARAVRHDAAHRRRSSRVWSLIGDAGETYDLTNIGTLFAFALVCIGVIVLRYTDPERPRPFRVPFVHVVGIVGAALCVFVMRGLARSSHGSASGGGCVIGLVLYFAYGYRNSTLRRGTGPVSWSSSSR